MHDTTSPLQLAFAFVLCMAMTAGFYQLVGRFMVTYRVLPDRIQFRALGIVPVAHVLYANIAEIRETPWHEVLNPFRTNPYNVLSLHNRVFGKWILIVKKRGYPRKLFLTPRDADHFVEVVKRKMCSVQK